MKRWKIFFCGLIFFSKICEGQFGSRTVPGEWPLSEFILSILCLRNNKSSAVWTAHHKSETCKNHGAGPVVKPYLVQPLIALNIHLSPFISIGGPRMYCYDWIPHRYVSRYCAITTDCVYPLWHSNLDNIKDLVSKKLINSSSGKWQFTMDGICPARDVIIFVPM